MIARRWFRTLTARLVVTAVALVAVVCVLIATATTLAMRAELMERLDGDVTSLARGSMAPPGAIDGRNRGPGTLVAVLSADQRDGHVLGDQPGEQDALSASALDRLADVPTDGEPHTVDVPGQGEYRVIAVEGSLAQTGGEAVAVSGLPTDDVTETLQNLIEWEALLTLLGIAAAAVVGNVVVRRQLTSLREVAATAHAVSALPLAHGEIELAARVPARLADDHSEVGQVGVALNTLLDHVEDALAARYRSEQQVRQFVADASHELRTPLTTIRGYTELARSRPGDGETTAMAIEKVAEESTRMTGMVEDLLLLARLDQGRPLERRPVDLTKLLVEAVEDARIVARDHRWRLALAPDLSPEDSVVTVPGDAARLHQVISNLLTNARRHTPSGTTVTTTVRPDGFTVGDDGPGFPPELVPTAFERFTRADASRRRTGDAGEHGSGLGLSIVAAIVAAHGGSVDLESEPGRTAVTVTLPTA